MIRVLISGVCGRMGMQTAQAVDSCDDLELVGGVDINPARTTLSLPSGDSVFIYTSLIDAIDATMPDVMVDFTNPSVVEGNIRVALSYGVNCVIGTTGIAAEILEELASRARDEAALFVAPNFTTGAVLMMEFSKVAAKYFPDIEIIEMHHDGKADAPSGTAIRTAHLIAQNKREATEAPGKETELSGFEGARGTLVEGIPVHSVRTGGFSAHQEVIFGSPGQNLTIRHDSIDRSSYMPGVLLACHEVPSRTGLIIGLENLMDD